ncbi:hypothetical protein DFH29DRAFT_879890, partial [Suillus ampliporus]
MASYLEFGDDFHHPERTRSVTLEQLVNIKADPNNLEAFFEACAEYQLNSVYAPFWMSWLYADPLPISGYRHFSSGVSKLKQVTGRVHHDVQRYIVGLITGAAPRCFVIAIRALMDVQYMVQSPSLNDDLLASIDQSLLIFHDNKDVIMRLGARTGTTRKKPIDNWFIPKLELMQSITTNATKHAHISEIKDPADTPTIMTMIRKSVVTWIDWRSYGAWDEGAEEEGAEEEGTACDEEPTDPRTVLLEELNSTHITTDYFSKAKDIAAILRQASTYPGPPRTFTTGNVAIHLNYDPTHTRMKLDDVSNNFNIPDLRHALSDFLRRDTRNGNMIHGVGVPRRSLIDDPPTLPFDCVQVWHM